MAKSFFALFTMTMIALVSFSVAGMAAEKTADPCSLLTLAEIQDALGKPVQGRYTEGPVPPRRLELTAHFVVGDFGSFNILIKPAYAGETPERIKAQFAKMKMKPVDLPNVGDSSFFTSPGFGMTQLQTFKGSRYILFTLLVPGATEPIQQVAAAKLMRLLLTRIK